VIKWALARDQRENSERFFGHLDGRSDSFALCVPGPGREKLTTAYGRIRIPPALPSV
jgi:hypothetical protein